MQLRRLNFKNIASTLLFCLQHTLLLTTLYCLFFGTTSGQNYSSDTLSKMIVAGKCNRVIEICDSITQSPNIQSDKVKIADFWNQKANCLRRIGKVKEAVELHLIVLSIRSTELGERSLAVANSSQNIGNCYLQLNQPNKAQPFLEKTLAIRSEQLDENHPALASVYLSLGVASKKKNDLSNAAMYFKKALEIKQIQFGELNPQTISALVNIGSLLLEVASPVEAQVYFEQALTIQVDSVGYIHPRTALIYTNLANCYAEQNQLDKAIVQHEAALEIYANPNLQLDAQLIADTHQNLGNVYLSIGDYEQALLHFNKALSLQNNYDPIAKLKLLNNIGLAQRYQLSTESAIQTFEQIIGQYPHEDDFLGAVFENLASCLFDEEIFDGAITFYEKALHIYGKNESKTENILAQIGICYFELKNYEQSQEIFYTLSQDNDALHLYHLGRIAQQRDKLDKADQLFRKALLYYPKEYSLELKAMILLAQANTLQAMKKWKQAWKTYLAAQQLAIQIDEKLENVSSRVYLNDRFSDLYDGMVKTAYELGQTNPSYLKFALQYSEQSKANVLKQLIQDEQLVPDSVLQKKRQLELALESIDRIIFEETSNRVLADENKLSDAYAERYTLKMQLNDLPQAKMPNSKTPIIELEDIQNRLHEGQSLLNYHISRQAIFIFHIEKYGFNVIEISKPQNFEEQLVELYNSLRTRPDVLPNPDRSYLAYTQLAHTFFKLLIQPIESQLKSEVLIIPDKLLAYLPFEVLLSSLPENPNLFKEHSYLLHQYSFHYSYSIELWLKMKSIDSFKQKVNALTIAPDFTGLDLPVLTYNIPEAKSIRNIIHSKVLLAKRAQEARFKAILHQYNVIHFSTHGAVNNINPAFSYLAFAHPEDSLQDGRLYANEINNLNLKADMVFLSACQTNIGKSFKGEGLMSLARAFTFAGAKSIVASLWSIDDKQTKYIVEHTYQALKDGKAKHNALKKAKQHFLFNAQQVHAHPYYWSGLILIGDEATLNIANYPFEQWAYTLSLLLVIGILIKYFMAR